MAYDHRFTAAWVRSSLGYIGVMLVHVANGLRNNGLEWVNRGLIPFGVRFGFVFVFFCQWVRRDELCNGLRTGFKRSMGSVLKMGSYTGSKVISTAGNESCWPLETKERRC